MAKINYWNYPPEWLPLIQKILSWNDRYFFVSIRRKSNFGDRRRRIGLSQRTLIPLAAELWATLTTAEKSLWTSASALEDQKNFNLFLQEFSNATINNLIPPQVPDQLAQNKVGRIQIGNPAAGILLKQEHPYSYFLKRKVVNTRDMYELVEVVENMIYPLTLAISYKTNLTNTFNQSSVKFYAEVVSHYQGRDITRTHEIVIPLQSAWARQSVTFQEVKGFTKSYTLYIDLKNVQGRFEMDNLSAEHSGQNWVRDFRCNNITTDVTRAFTTMAKNWESVIQPAGAVYSSIYRMVN